MGPTKSIMQKLLTEGVVISASGNPSTGKSLALQIIKESLRSYGWAIIIDDPESHEIVVTKPERNGV